MLGSGLAPRRVETTLPRSDGDDLIPIPGIRLYCRGCGLVWKFLSWWKLIQVPGKIFFCLTLKLYWFVISRLILFSDGFWSIWRWLVWACFLTAGLFTAPPLSADIFSVFIFFLLHAVVGWSVCSRISGVLITTVTAYSGGRKSIFYLLLSLRYVRYFVVLRIRNFWIRQIGSFGFESAIFVRIRPLIWNSATI